MHQRQLYGRSYVIPTFTRGPLHQSQAPPLQKRRPRRPSRQGIRLARCSKSCDAGIFRHNLKRSRCDDLVACLEAHYTPKFIHGMFRPPEEALQVSVRRLVRMLLSARPMTFGTHHLVSAWMPRLAKCARCEPVLAFGVTPMTPCVHTYGEV